MSTINEKSSLISRIEYYMEHPEDTDTLKNIFTAEEIDILYTISEFEQIKAKNSEKLDKDVGEEVDFFLERVDREREISFRLKEQVMCQLDVLLGKGSIEAWTEMIIWYRLLQGKKLIVYGFWEFPVLENMLKIFKEETKNMESGEIYVLSLRNMKELTEMYFRMVFMLRRMAYGLEVTDEIVDYITGKKLFPVFIKVMAEDSSIEIHDRETILNELPGRRLRDDS